MRRKLDQESTSPNLFPAPEGGRDGALATAAKEPAVAKHQLALQRRVAALEEELRGHALNLEAEETALGNTKKTILLRRERMAQIRGALSELRALG